MLRWIVAGVLLVVLVGLIVSNGWRADGADTGTAAAGDADGGGAEVRPGVEEACGDLMARITAARGEPFMVALGDGLFEVLEADDVVTLCGEVGALPVDEAIARLESAAE